VPSLEVVEAALAREEDSYRHRAAGIDTRAGLLLGAAGALVALVGTQPTLAGAGAQVLAAGAGGAAVLTLWSRVDKGIAPRSLRNRYLAVDPVRTRLILLNTRLEVHAQDERQLVTKARRLRVSAALLLVATAVIVVGGIVSLF
jgi:hypothetical protein